MRKKKQKEFKPRFSNPFPDLKTAKPGVPQVSNGFANCSAKKDPLAHRWQKGAEEKPETIAAIEAREQQVAPAYNKGPIMLISGSPEDIGKK